MVCFTANFLLQDNNYLIFILFSPYGMYLSVYNCKYQVTPEFSSGETLQQQMGLTYMGKKGWVLVFLLVSVFYFSALTPPSPHQIYITDLSGYYT